MFYFYNQKSIFRYSSTTINAYSKTDFLKVIDYLGHLGDSAMTTSTFFSLRTRTWLHKSSRCTQRIRGKVCGRHEAFEFGVNA